MKFVFITLITLLSCLDVRGVVNHSSMSKWKSIRVERLGVSFMAPASLYDQDVLNEEAIARLGYVRYRFSLHKIRFGGFLSERRPIITAWFIMFTPEQYKKNIEDRGYNVGSFIENAAVFHVKTTKYADSRVGSFRGFFYRRDFKAANGNVVCVQIDRMDVEEAGPFSKEDEMAIFRILDSVEFTPQRTI